MRIFLRKPVLGSIVFLFLISSGILGAEIFYGVGSVYQANQEIVPETAPIRVGETVISYDFPYEPQIIERRIISTRIISPPENSEIKTSENQLLQPLRQTEEKKSAPNNTNKSESSEISAVDPKTSVETTGEKSFQEITFPPVTESDRITTLKPTQPFPNEPKNKPNKEPDNKPDNESNNKLTKAPKQAPPVSTTVRGQSSGFAGEIERALEEPLPLPKGLVDASAIDPKLYENTAESTGNKNSSEQNELSAATTGNNSAVISNKPTENNKSANEKQTNGVNGILLLVTIVSVAMLIYAVVIAFDYHQRWIQSLTTQNNRFSGLSDSVFSGDDTDMDADFSGNIPLYNGNNNIPAGLSRFRSESQYY